MGARPLAPLLLALLACDRGGERAAPDLGETPALIASRLTAAWGPGAEPAPVDDLLLLRRLHLGLLGSIPSLAEIRAFEAEPPGARLDRALERLLADPRSARHLAEHWARALAGDAEVFVVFRREVLSAWLAAELARERPFDQVVRALVEARGLWTGDPPVNFLTAASTEGEIDEAVLAGRTARVLLGARLECAQCHDHPFAEVSQAQFAGLAAFYAGTRITALGVSDTRSASAAPAVPYGASWLPPQGPPRQRLAAWLTHPAHGAFGRAVANRVWALLYGRALVEPVDDLAGEASPLSRELLDILAEDFQRHGADLRRLIRLAVGAPTFRRPSAGEHDGSWRSFPATPLGARALGRSLTQAAALTPREAGEHWLLRGLARIQLGEFVAAHGDPGERELEVHPRSVQQELLTMNGPLTQGASEPGLASAAGRIAAFAADDAQALELLFLTFLTRRPGEDERRRFLPLLAGVADRQRPELVADLAWALASSEEMTWSH